MNRWCILLLVLSASIINSSYLHLDDKVALTEIASLEEQLTALILHPMLSKLEELDRKFEDIRGTTEVCIQDTQQKSAEAIRYLGQQILDLNLNFMNTSQQLMLNQKVIARNYTRYVLHQRLFFEAVKPNFGSLLISAATNGDSERVVGLLELGTPIEFEDFENNRPLHKATNNFKTEILKILLDHGANVDSKGKEDYTPLHFASENGCLECARMLLTKGASVDSRNYYRYTPLMKSAIAGHDDLVKLLLENGADVNAVQFMYYSALHMAASEGFVSTVEILVQYGADVSLKTETGHTALDLAKEYGHQEVISFLKNNTKYSLL